MKVTFLIADVPLTKAYTQTTNAATKTSEIQKTPYPFVWEFTSQDHDVADLVQLHGALKRHALAGHCLLKGNVGRPLVKESRAGSTDPNGTTQFVVLDLDGLEAPSIDAFLEAIGIEDTSYIVQWSASYGIENKLLRAHVLLMLDKPVAAPLLKQWLIQVNHETSLLRDAMTLTRTGNAISWPLDISACQNDKLIYIAPPVLKGIKDPVLPTERISLIRRRYDRLTLPASINSTAKNKELTHRRLEELREIAGLPKRKTKYRMVGATEVMVAPDACTISEMKHERGFVYFNLNGGDSWAYYHPENNPDVIFNFKGEPAYLTKELLPEYWEKLQASGARANSQGLAYLAFCDRATGAYWRGTYDGANDALELFLAKNETQVRHFAKQHGLPLGDFIPEWDLVFDPHDTVRVDFGNRVVNRFQLTAYMKAESKPQAQCPKTILKIVRHVLGDDEALVEHFMNWLAYIVQERDRTTTAWVWHGTQGTGKGILFNRVLRPLFGSAHTTARRMEELDEKYNGFMEESFLVYVDEVQTKALANERGVMAKMKNFITEERVTIRALYQNGREARNYSNWILASNMADPVLIERDDRRYNVGKYQPRKLQITDAELAQVDRELQRFYDYLYHYPVSKAKAQSVLETEDRQTMQSISESSVDTVVSAIQGGNFKFLMDQLPDTDHYKSNALELAKVEEYRQVLHHLLQRTDEQTGQVTISRDELRCIFNYVVGNMPTSPNKFTSLLKHHRMHISDVWMNDGTNARTVRGIKATFADRRMWPAWQKSFDPKAQPSRSLKVVT